MNPYNIIIADDHAILRKGIKKIIEEASGMSVIAEVGDGLELLNLLEKVTPDMIILDISMPTIRGIELTREIKDIYPKIKILILTMHKSKEYLIQAISSGADGYLVKEDSDEELFVAINTIRNGNIYLSPAISKGASIEFIEALQKGNKKIDDPLTPREKEVLKLIVEGYTCKDIAGMLFISPRTAQHHRARLLKKLRIKSVPDLVQYAIQKGYISMP